MLQHPRKGCAASEGLSHPNAAPAGMQNSCLPGCATFAHPVSPGMFWVSQGRGKKGWNPWHFWFWFLVGKPGDSGAVLPYLSGVLRSFANKQAYKVRFIALGFLLGNWSPFNVGHALWTLCQWSWPEGCVYMCVCGVYIWCSCCKQLLVVAQFNRNTSSNWNGKSEKWSYNTFLLFIMQQVAFKSFAWEFWRADVCAHAHMTLHWSHQFFLLILIVLMEKKVTWLYTLQFGFLSENSCEKNISKAY